MYILFLRFSNYKYSWKTTNTPEQNASAKYPRLSYGAEAGSSNNMLSQEDQYSQ